MASDDVQFDDRIRQVGDNGAAFEEFAFDVFSIIESTRLEMRLARGRDGAVDLFRNGHGVTIIAEAKYVGDRKASTVEQRWREVAKRLKTNLPALSANPKWRQGSPYRLWLDTNQPVQLYRLCVSCSLSEVQAKSLTEEIRDTFAQIVELGAKELEYLANPINNAVEVLSWDWFRPRLNLHPSLKFHWFGGLPVGLETFQPETTPTGTFKDFLRSDTLRYFSRQAFADVMQQREMLPEGSLLAELREGRRARALIISGKGGIGKTRLSWELVSQAIRSKQDSVAFRIDRSASAQSILDLVGSYPTPQQFFFLIDYAEAVGALAEIAWALNDAQRTGGHRVRVIATCRLSARSRVEDGFAVLEPMQMTFGEARAGEAAYLSWVTRSILQEEGIPNIEDVAPACHDMPALAAFAVFLYRRHRALFDIQFGGLQATDDFRAWVRRRVTALTHGLCSESEGLRAMADIVLALPMDTDARDRLVDEGGVRAHLLERLEDDRWIEIDHGVVAPTHDVLADAIVARWLLETGSATSRTTDALRRAAQRDRLDSALITMDRLALHPAFADVDGNEVLQRLYRTEKIAVESAARYVLSSRLLDHRRKLQFLADTASFALAVASDRSCDLNLSLIAEDCINDQEWSPVTTCVESFCALLDRAVAADHPSNMVLRRAYVFAPDRYRTAVHQAIAAAPTAIQTHYLLTAMLRKGEPPETLVKPLTAWLERDADDAKASFVLEAWCEAGGALEIIKPFSKRWLVNHGRDEVAFHVITAWLKAKGSTEEIQQDLIQWLTVHQTSYVSCYCLTEWLLQNGDVDSIRPFLFLWLKRFPSAFGTSRIICAWLASSQNPQEIEDFMYSWLAEHSLAEEAKFVFSAWLSSGGDSSKIQREVMEWLNAFGTNRSAYSVLNDWLSNKANPQVVQLPLKRWLDEHGDVREAGPLIYSWIQTGESIDWILPKLFRWLSEWRHDPIASYPIRFLSGLDDLPDAVLKDAIIWCALHRDHVDALNRVSRLSVYLRKAATSYEAFDGLRTICYHVLRDDLRDRKHRDEYDFRRYIICLQNFLSSANGPDWHGRSTKILVDTIASAEILVGAASNMLANSTLLARINEALRSHQLDLNFHSRGLTSLADWLCLQSDNEYANMFLIQVRKHWPSGIWDGNQR